MPQINLPLRSTALISAVVGIALISALAMYFRRRKRGRAKLFHEIYIEPTSVSKDSVDGDSLGRRSVRSRSRQTTAENIQNLSARRRLNSKLNASNGDVSRSSHSPSPGTMLTRSGSTISVKSDAYSASTITALCATRDDGVTPGLLLELGLDLVVKARCRWEMAIQQIDEMDSVDEDGVELRSQLAQLVELSLKMQNGCKSDFLGQICASAALDAALDEMDREYEERRRKTNKYSYADSSSDLDSFVSALSMADLSDLDDQRETFQHLALYEAALLELSHGTVQVRMLRTKMVNCSSDTEFLAKLHCIRLAFSVLFEDEANRDWFSSLGRSFISNLLANADRDTDDFLTAYDSMIEYVTDGSNWTDIEEELRCRGVKMMSFYDIVVDFLLFDAFDDLDNPPTSVTAILHNRWLTSGFKETALSTAVWSVLKAKRTMLKFPKGFIAHFYTISETTSPVFALGFLGPDGPLKDMCNFFKDQVCGFMWDIFSFEKAHYTTVEQLAEDILYISKQHAAIAQQQLGGPQSVEFS